MASYGPGKAQRDRYVKYLARFAAARKEAPEDKRLAPFGDTWIFREFVDEEVGGPALMQREALLHLVFPETFEHALAPDDKARI